MKDWKGVKGYEIGAKWCTVPQNGQKHHETEARHWEMVRNGQTMASRWHKMLLNGPECAKKLPLCGTVLGDEGFM